MRFMRGFMLIIGFMGAVAASPCAKADVGTEVSIHLDKRNYKMGDKLQGEVQIFSSVPSTIPKSYSVSIYRQGVLKKNFRTNIRMVFFGTNKYSLKEFGIPTLTQAYYGPGLWEIVIKESSGIEPKDKNSAEFYIKQ